MKELPKIFLKAAPGRRVKDPITLALLDADGEWKPSISYWHRRLRDGDVIEATPADAQKSKPKQARAEAVKE